MTDFTNPGAVSTAPAGATSVSPTAALDFIARASACLGEDVHVIGSTRQSGWEQQDGAVYRSEFLNVGDHTMLAAVGVSTGKTFTLLGYGLHQQVTRDASSGTPVTTAHVERWWLVLDPETWKVYRFVNKYDLVSLPWSYTESARVDDCIQL